MKRCDDAPVGARDRLDRDHRRGRPHAAEDRREGHVGGVAPGAETHEAHRDRGARRVEHVPAPAEVALDVGVKVGRPEGRVGAVVDAGREARRDVDRTAQRDHQMREVAAHADLLEQRVERRGLRVAGVRRERGALEHPVANPLHAAVALPARAELAHRELVQAIRLAIAARVDVAQHRRRQLRDRHLGDRRRQLHVVIDLDRRLVQHLQRPGLRGQAQVAVAGGRVGLDAPGHRLAQRQHFVQHALACGQRRVDVEDEIAAGIEDLVVELQRELKTGHALPMRICSHMFRPVTVSCSEPPFHSSQYSAT